MSWNRSCRSGRPWMTLGLNMSLRALQRMNPAWRATRLPSRPSRRILRMSVPLS
jgi:hypothetical protein